jgi:hypothetical protein
VGALGAMDLEGTERPVELLYRPEGRSLTKAFDDALGTCCYAMRF